MHISIGLLLKYEYYYTEFKYKYSTSREYKYKYCTSSFQDDPVSNTTVPSMEILIL